MRSDNQSPSLTARSPRVAALLAHNVQSAGAAGATRAWPLNPPSPSRPPSPPDAPVGQRYLSRLLSVHDLLRLRGVAAAFGVLSRAQIAEAVEACNYFDLYDLAATVAAIPLAGSSPNSARVFDAEYRQRFATTDRVVTAIYQRIATRPDDFPGDPD